MNKKLEKFLAPNEKVVEVISYSKAQFIWDLAWGCSFTCCCCWFISYT